MSLRWRHNGRDSVSNHQPHHCLLKRLFRRISKKTSKFRVTGLCGGLHREPVISLHKWPVTRKMFPFDDVIMVKAFKTSSSSNPLVKTRNRVIGCYNGRIALTWNFTGIGSVLLDFRRVFVLFFPNETDENYMVCVYSCKVVGHADRWLFYDRRGKRWKPTGVMMPILSFVTLNIRCRQWLNCHRVQISQWRWSGALVKIANVTFMGMQCAWKTRCLCPRTFLSITGFGIVTMDLLYMKFTFLST